MLKTEVMWNQKRKEMFLSAVSLTRAELEVFDKILEGVSYIQIADEHKNNGYESDWDEDKVKRIVKKLKIKYDFARTEFPELPERNIKKNITKKEKDEIIEEIGKELDNKKRTYESL